MLPNHLAQKTRCRAFKDVKEESQFILDLRTEDQRNADNNDKPRKTLNFNLEVIKERP